MDGANTSSEGRRDRMDGVPEYLGILAGPEKVLFTIHRDHLTHSAYFDRLLNTWHETGEPTAFTIKLPNVNIETLEIVSEVLQGGNGNLGTDDFDEKCGMLVRMYILAGELEIAVLQNRIIDLIYQHSVEDGRIPLKCVGYVWENTHNGSKLREFLSDFCCYRAGDGEDYDFENGDPDAPDLPKGFYLPMIYRLNALLKNAEEAMTAVLKDEWTGWNDDADLEAREKYYVKSGFADDDNEEQAMPEDHDQDDTEDLGGFGREDNDDDDDDMDGQVLTKRKQEDHDEQMRDDDNQEEEEKQPFRRSKRLRGRRSSNSDGGDEEQKAKKVAVQKASASVSTPPQDFTDQFNEASEEIALQRKHPSMNTPVQDFIDFCNDSEYSDGTPPFLKPFKTHDTPPRTPKSPRLISPYKHSYGKVNSGSKQLHLNGGKGFKELKNVHFRYHVGKALAAGQEAQRNSMMTPSQNPKASKVTNAREARKSARETWSKSYFEKDSDEEEFPLTPSKSPQPPRSSKFVKFTKSPAATNASKSSASRKSAPKKAMSSVKKDSDEDELPESPFSTPIKRSSRRSSSSRSSAARCQSFIESRAVRAPGMRYSKTIFGRGFGF